LGAKAGSADILSAAAGSLFTLPLVVARVEADRMSALPAFLEYSKSDPNLLFVNRLFKPKEYRAPEFGSAIKEQFFHY
jgi:hypothetical protein